MPRYIDADKLLEELKEEIDYETPMYTDEQNKFFVRGLKCALRDVKSQPTADVVPKSEVDLYRKQVDELEDELSLTYDKLEKAKAEGEKIIEEAFKMMQDNFVNTPIYKVFPSDLKAELKKKYLGGDD